MKLFLSKLVVTIALLPLSFAGPESETLDNAGVNIKRASECGVSGLHYRAHLIDTKRNLTVSLSLSLPSQ